MSSSRFLLTNFNKWKIIDKQKIFLKTFPVSTCQASPLPNLMEKWLQSLATEHFSMTRALKKYFHGILLFYHIANRLFQRKNRSQMCSLTFWKTFQSLHLKRKKVLNAAQQQFLRFLPNHKLYMLCLCILIYMIPNQKGIHKILLQAVAKQSIHFMQKHSVALHYNPIFHRLFEVRHSL